MLTIKIGQVVVAILLIGAILLQSRGVGLSATFGGEGGFYRTKRGFEKLIFIFTILLALAFAGLSLTLAFTG